jgi:hypothetical protein
MLGKSICLGVFGVGLVALMLPGCGGDDEKSACDKAWTAWCACPQVTCDGHPDSCSGPDKEWADCINAAADACTSTCTP